MKPLNNPGNLRTRTDITWTGQDGATEDGFCNFTSLHWGLRAMALNLVHYIVLDGCTTLNAIIDRWAPPEENATANYLADVSAWTGWSPAYKPSLPDDLKPLILAIVRQEGDGDNVTEGDVDAILKIFPFNV